MNDKKVTIIGEDVTDLVVYELERKDIEDGDSVIIEPEALIFRDGTRLGVKHSGDKLTKFVVSAGTALSREHDKVTALEVSENPELSELDILLTADRTVAGGGGLNVAKVLGFLGLPAAYLSLHPKGTIKPQIPDGIESRIIELELEQATPKLNLVISKVKDRGTTIVNDKRIIKHPRNNMDYSAELELPEGVLVLDSVAYKGLVSRVLSESARQNITAKKLYGIAALTDKMKGDIAYSVLSHGFDLVMNECEICNHANQLCPLLNLSPFIDGQLNLAALLTAANYLRELTKQSYGNYQFIFVSLGEKGSLAIDKQGRVYYSGVFLPGIEPKNTNAAGDTYTAGIVALTFIEQTTGMSYSIEDKVKFATALARAKIDEKLSSGYIAKLLSTPFKFIMLPKSVSEYANEVLYTRGGMKRVNQTLLDFIEREESAIIYYKVKPKVIANVRT